MSLIRIYSDEVGPTLDILKENRYENFQVFSVAPFM